MNNRTENIAALFSGIGLFSHVLAYFFWSMIKLVNIYYVTVYFLMLMNGLALMIIARGKVMKYVSMGMFALGSHFIYMEFAGDPQDWKPINIITLVFIFANSMLISYLLERYKKRKLYG